LLQAQGIKRIKGSVSRWNHSEFETYPSRED
jgi:hypothetical protein